MNQLGEYIDKLIEDKGFGDLEADILDEMRADLNSRLEDRINAVVLERMPASSMDEFEKVLARDDVDEVAEFYKKHIPDIERFIAEELVAFRNTYLA